MLRTQEIEQAVTAFAERFSQRAGEELESIVYSPFPFTGGQLLVACKDRVSFLREVLVAAHLSDPPQIPIHWLHASELHLLSLPSVIGRYAGWSYWLRYKGKVLWGSDIRDRIPLPEDPRRMLEVIVSHSITWDRDHLFLEYLAQEKNAELIEALSILARSLMATALLLRGEWEVDEDTVLDRFAAAFRTDGAEDLCRQLSEVFGGTEDLHRRAREGVWLLEQLFRLLRRFVE